MHDGQEHFQNYVSCTGRVLVAGGYILESKCCGDIYVKFVNECGGKYAILCDVLHVPAFQGSLLSMTRLADQKFKCTVDDWEINIYTKDWVYESSALCRGDLYCIMEDDVTRANMVVMVKNVSVMDTTLWHRQLST